MRKKTTSLCGSPIPKTTAAAFRQEIEEGARLAQEHYDCGMNTIIFSPVEAELYRRSVKARKDEGGVIGS